MRGLFTVFIVMLVLSSITGGAYFFIGAEDPGQQTIEPKVPENERGRERPDQPTPRELVGSSQPISKPNGKPATKTGKPAQARDQAALDASEAAAHQIYEEVLRPDVPLEDRMASLQRFIEASRGVLPNDEIGHRVLQLIDLQPEDRDGSFQAGVLRSLKGLKSESLLSKILESVDHAKAKVRVGALDALAVYRDDAAVRDKFKQALRDTDPTVRERARELLDK